MNVHQSTISQHIPVKLLRVDSAAALPQALDAAGLERSRPTLVIIGGASKLRDADFAKVERLFVEVLTPLAEAKRLNVVDGGTDAGVMRLIGQARAAANGTFPLIGVAPVGLVDLPEYRSNGAMSADVSPLEPHHTHCLLVPGHDWGDESAWIALVATHLAGTAGSAAVLINGGEITWKDAAANALAGRDIVVVAGSGRTADLIAAAHGGSPSDPRAASLLASNHIQIIDLAYPQQLEAALSALL
ncbi:MAG: hypothetical protein ACFB4J_01675 [Elainellaceae cyanobacterium]